MLPGSHAKPAAACLNCKQKGRKCQVSVHRYRPGAAAAAPSDTSIACARLRNDAKLSVRCNAPQVLCAAAVKWRLRPAPPAELHELRDGKSAVRGSRLLAHTNYCKRAPALWARAELGLAACLAAQTCAADQHVLGPHMACLGLCYNPL